MNKSVIGLLMVAGLSAGCSFAARDDDTYQREVKALLETKGDSVAQCWGDARKADGQAQGTVTVKFKIAADTGVIESPAVDSAGTTAPEPVQKCVLSSLDGLVLEPGDQRSADATYVWELGSP